MKTLFISLLFVFTLYGDEMQRIETILKDTTELRVKYEKCQSELTAQDTLGNSLKRCEKLTALQEKKIKNLENKLQKQKKKYLKLLKTKDKKINNLKRKLSYKKVKQPKKKIKKKKFGYSNKFPQLVLKSRFLKEEKFEAQAFLLQNDTQLFDSIDGKVVRNWQKGTTFTSNTRCGVWIKVTGYFEQKKWKPADENLWVFEKDVVLK